MRTYTDLPSDSVAFLRDEIRRADAMLARLARLEESLLAASSYEQLADTKAYKQLRRDQTTFQLQWLRAERRLAEITKSKPSSPPPQPEAQTRSKEPGRNAPCPCGSTVKYKRCCGNPLRPGPARSREGDWTVAAESGPRPDSMRPNSS